MSLTWFEQMLMLKFRVVNIDPQDILSADRWLKISDTNFPLTIWRELGLLAKYLTNNLTDFS